MARKLTLAERQNMMRQRMLDAKKKNKKPVPCRPRLTKPTKPASTLVRKLRRDISRLKYQVKIERRKRVMDKNRLVTHMLGMPETSRYPEGETPPPPENDVQARKQRLWYIRKRLGLTLTQFSSLMGMHPRYVRELTARKGINDRNMSLTISLLAEKYLLEYHVAQKRRRTRLKKLQRDQHSIMTSEELLDRGLPEIYLDQELRHKIIMMWAVDDLSAEEIATKLAVRPEVVLWHVDGID